MVQLITLLAATATALAPAVLALPQVYDPSSSVQEPQEPPSSYNTTVQEDQDRLESMVELLRRQSTPSSSGTHNGYFYSWWTDGSSPVTYTNGDGGSYSVEWESGGNFVGGKGWATGSAKSVSYTGSWAPVDNGNAVRYSFFSFFFGGGCCCCVLSPLCGYGHVYALCD